MGLLYFTALLGGLIFFHEFGHFIVARMCGVRVLVFSLGFGPRWTVYRSDRSGTEYCVSLLPLGGYVKMLGEDPEEPLMPEDVPDSFNSQALWKRFLIVFAGPFFNLILPVFIFFIMAMGASQLPPSEIGMVMEGGPAEAAGMQSGDRIVAINGEPVNYWWQLHEEIAGAAGVALDITWERAGKEQSAKITPSAREIVRAPQLGLVETRGQIRVGMDHLRPILHVAAGSSAEVAGLRSWDRLLALNGKPVERWYEVRRHIRAAAGQTVTLRVIPLERGLGTTAGVNLDAFSGTARDIVLTIPAAEPDPLQALGVTQSETIVFEVKEGTPASDQLGLVPGDRILALDGEPVQRWRYMLARIHEAPEQERTVQFQRGNEVFTRSFTPVEKSVRGEFNNEARKVVFGAENLSEVGFPDDVANDHLLAFALHRAFGETWEAIRLNVHAIGGLFVGKVPMSQLGGPIFIGQLAAKTGEKEHKARWFFGIMVMLSINLGLLNLLPIPMLDGGHLMFFAIEAVKRSPVSIRTRQIAAYAGLSFILMLMILVFKNDLSRLFDTL